MFPSHFTGYEGVRSGPPFQVYNLIRFILTLLRDLDTFLMLYCGFVTIQILIISIGYGSTVKGGETVPTNIIKL